MNKNEIIQALACTNVPPGSTLISHSAPELGVNYTRIDSGDVGGMKVLLAQIIEEQLSADTAENADIPDADLFARLHLSSLNFHMAMIEGSIFDAVEEEAAVAHRMLIARLKQIACELGISYKEPDDPLKK